MTETAIATECFEEIAKDLKRIAEAAERIDERLAELVENTDFLVDCVEKEDSDKAVFFRIVDVGRQVR